MSLVTFAAQTADPATQSWLTFASSLVASLAWPSTVVLLALVFRVVLRNLIGAFTERIGQMTGLKLPGGVEAAWAEKLQEVASEVLAGAATAATTDKQVPLAGETADHGQQAPPQPASPGNSEATGDHVSPTAPTPSTTPTRSTAKELAEVSPPAAVIAAFLPIERAIEQFLRAAGEQPGSSLVGSFMRSPQAPSKLKRSVQDLSNLRNRAAHDPNLALSARDALNYVETASALEAQLYRATDGLIAR